MPSKYLAPSHQIYIRLGNTLPWLDDNVLEISYILHKKREYAIKEDAKNKSKLNNSDNIDCYIKNPSTWKREEKKGKKLENYLRNKSKMKN